MKILHTSDWHLGSTLCGKKRYNEFDHFFDWMIDCITKERIDVILISGDIFDTSNPTPKQSNIILISSAGLQKPAVNTLLSLLEIMTLPHFLMRRGNC